MSPGLEFMVDRFAYGRTSEAFALRDVEFGCARGRVHGLLGHNGAGKTTLLLLAAGFLEPQEGVVLLDGRSTTEPELRPRIGVMTEKLKLYDRFTVRETLEVFAGLYDVAEPAKAVARAMDEFGLHQHAGAQIRDLSTGLAKRAVLATVLLNEPDVVLLDEPFAGIDPVSVESVMDAVRHRAGRGAVVLIASHDLPEIERVADDVTVIREGSVVTGGRLPDVLHGPATRTATIRTAGGEVRVPADAAALADCFASLAAAGAEIRDISTERPTLAQVYAELHNEGAPNPSRPGRTP